MSFFTAFSAIAVIFAAVLTGFIANKLGYLDAPFCRKLSALVINVTQPFLILASAMTGKFPSSGSILSVLLWGTLAFLFMALISRPITALLRVEDSDRGIFQFMLTFGNNAFIGFPMTAALFGFEYVLYAAILTLPANILIFTAGMLFVAGSAGAKFSWRLLATPPLIAAYAAATLSMFQIEMPKIASDICSLIGQTTIPASLLVIGSSLADLRLRDMLCDRRICVVCLLKMLVVPALIGFALRFAPLEKTYADLIMILCAMPVAALGVMFCANFGVNPKKMAAGTFWSTLMSLVTIPILGFLI